MATVAKPGKDLEKRDRIVKKFSKAAKRAKEDA